jgi:hypothetical protein
MIFDSVSQKSSVFSMVTEFEVKGMVKEVLAMAPSLGAVVKAVGDGEVRSPEDVAEALALLDKQREREADEVAAFAAALTEEEGAL